MAAPFFAIGLYLAALVTLVDQGSKYVVMTYILNQRQIEGITSYLNLRISWNKGVTFGLFNNFHEYMPYILITVALLIMLLLMGWLRRAENLWATMGLGFIMGGALGNVIDRVRFGAVLDFLDFHYQDYHWYTFNIADSAIVLGVGLLIMESVLSRKVSK